MEVSRIVFDTAKTNLNELLEAFWQMHDPTTPNRQGNDVGTQYRSAIFYNDDKQRMIIEASKQAAAKSLSQVPSSRKSCRWKRFTRQRITIRIITT